MNRNSLWMIWPLVCAMAGCTERTLVVSAADPALSLRQDSMYYRDRPFTGMVLSMHSSGDTASVGSWLNGIEDGRFQRRYPDGKIAEERWFKKGRKTGLHQGWYPNGQPQFAYEFLNGEHHGKAEEWYPTGQPYRIFQYNAGYEEGLQRMWWEDGRLRANYAVRKGRRYGLIGLKLCRNPADSLHP